MRNALSTSTRRNSDLFHGGYLSISHSGEPGHSLLLILSFSPSSNRSSALKRTIGVPSPITTMSRYYLFTLPKVILSTSFYPICRPCMTSDSLQPLPVHRDSISSSSNDSENSNSNAKSNSIGNNSSSGVRHSVRISEVGITSPLVNKLREITTLPRAGGMYLSCVYLLYARSRVRKLGTPSLSRAVSVTTSLSL